MKKTIIIIVIVLGVLVSCSPKNTKKVELKMWAMGEEAIKLEEFKHAFEEEYPNIDLKIQAVPWDAVHSKLLTAISGDTTPDLSQMGTSFMAQFISIGAFEELDSNLTISKKDFFESALSTNESNGKLYGIPWYTETRVIFYKKDLLSKAGFEEFPRTWKELKEYTSALKKLGVKYPITMPVNEPNTPTEMYSLIWQNGSDVLDENKNILVNTPEFKEAIRFYTSFFKDKEAPIELTGELVSLFAKGDLATFISGPWMTGIIQNATPEIEGKWDIATMPKKKFATSFVGGSNLVVFKKAKHKKEALLFLEFMSRPEIQIKWFEANKNLPAVISAWNDKKIQEQKYIKVFGEQLKDAKAPHSFPEMAEIHNALGNKVEEVIFDKKDIDTAMAELEKEIQFIIKQ